MADQTTRQRRVDLDWIRIIAFGLLILYHVGMLFVPWDFHVKSRHILPGLEPVMLALNPWRLCLLFVVSGAATRFMTESRPPATLFSARASRLLPPVLFGMWVLVPPQSYLELVERWGYAGSFLDFYRSYELSLPGKLCEAGHCLILPTWNHLWFVVYLFVYTALLALTLALLPGVLRGLERRLAPLLSGPALLIAPVLLLAAYRIVLAPRFPSTHALIDDWSNHALFATMFLFGYLFARAEAVAAATQRLRWPALAMAVGCYAVFIVLRALRPDGAAPTLPVMRPELLYATFQWGSIIAILGFGRIWLTRDSALRRYLTDAVFPFYIVHQTAIIIAAHALHDRDWPAAAEAAAVIGATLASCLLGYEIVRRVRWLRPLFGLNRNAAPSVMASIEPDIRQSVR